MIVGISRDVRYYRRGSLKLETMVKYGIHAGIVILGLFMTFCGT